MRKLFLITTMLAFSATGLWAQTGGDECVVADDIAVAGFGTYVVAMTNVGATTGIDPAPSIPCAVFGQNTDDIWFSFVPDADGAIDVTTCDPTSWDTDLLLYDGGSGCGALIELACSGDAITNPGPCQAFYSEFDAPTAVTGGNTYYLRIGNWGASGTGGAGNLTINFYAVGTEICDDGADNDADGLIDCADPDCIGVGLCGPEICDDGFDNDGDGLLDCFDPDCFGTPSCPAATNDECVGAVDIPIAGAGIYTAFMDSTTASLGADPLPGITCAVMGQFDNDIWFSFTPDVDMVMDIHTCDPTSWDTDLAVYEGDDCTTMNVIACNGDANILPGCQIFYSHVQFVSVTAGTTYKIRIGSYGLGVSGLGTLTLIAVVPAPEDCTNGVDDDLDGFIDCLDPDCFSDPSCTFTDGDECFVAIDVFDGGNAIDTNPYTASADASNITLCPAAVFGQNDMDGWYLYTATADATYWIHTCDPAGFDSDLLVYDFTAAGADCANIQGFEIACDGDSTALPGCQAFFSYVEVSLTAGNQYLIRVGSWAIGGGGTGTLNIVSLLCPPMAGLSSASDCTTGDVTLGWTANAYDQIEILRDTVLIDTVAGSDTSYIDPGLASGNYVYQVQGVCGGNVGGSQTISANVASYGGEPHVIFAVEGIDQTDSVAALQAALDANGILYVTTTLGPAAWGCLGSDSIQCAWMMTGTWPNDYRINDADGTALATAVENGKGVYFEAGDHWGFVHLVTAYDNYDGVDQSSVTDGNDTFLSMNGFDTGFGLDTSDLSGTAYNQAAAGNDYTDQFNVLAGAAGPNAGLLWSDAVAGYGTGAFYATDDPFGNTISQSWEFGGFGGDQVDLAARYIAALCGGAPPGTGFQRGDANGDGAFNIADLIFLLAALFSGGPGGDCGDANDVNDDGSINIADAINGLAALFSGGPTPPDPSPGACGTDPTDDALDCASYTSCP